MVNKSNKDRDQDEVEITNDDLEITEPDIEEIELNQGTFKNELRDKLKACEAEKKEILEETQRAKADFLNAKRRLEEEKKRDRERATIRHIESLIPLCDSFELAMNNKEVWEKADATWRKGIEGIRNQLNNILAVNQVTAVNPIGEVFDPYQHEALSTVAVDKESENEKVMHVIQQGYQIQKNDGTTELIRPARVTTGNYEKN